MTSGFWLRVAALALVIAGLGLPINDLFRYALLLIAAVPIFAGAVSKRPIAWLAALGIVAVTAAAQMVWPSPRIEEGHNVFVGGDRAGALMPGLPADAYRQMAAEFDARYPAASRCDPHEFGCWRDTAPPTRAYAFSADSIYGGADYSRRVSGMDFSDPIWLRLGFINEQQYNWTGPSDVQRGKRAPWWSVLHPWRLTLPYFVMVRLPADFIGSQMCWQGLVLWEEAGQRFAPSRHAEYSCRPVERSDIGRRIFGVSITAPLAMSIKPPLSIRLHKLAAPALALFAVGAVLLLLVRWRPRQLRLPFILIGLALLIVFLHDASFIGGIRPFDGGDDGLVYEGMARRMVQHALNGDFAAALKGEEAVFYYGGPGLRYFRTVEHFIFGDAFYGYLSLMLVLPLLVFAAMRRFLGARSALGLTLIFIAIPIGALFGTTYFQYVKWAARGFADPAAAAMFLGGFIALVGRNATGPRARFAPAFGAGLLFALALWLRPNLAPAAGILLGGAGLAALWHAQFRRVAGLCLGFLPVLGMALHNWIYGHVFVLFSANAMNAETIRMPPAAHLSALSELLRFDLGGEHVQRELIQIAGWLAGPSESFWMIPLHAAAVAVLVRVALYGRRHDPWLRLTAAAMLAQHPVALLYMPAGRYYYLTWFLTYLVCAVWMRDEGAELFRRYFPRATEWLSQHSMRYGLARMLDKWASIAAVPH